MSLVNNILLRPHTFQERQLPSSADIPSILMDLAARILKDVRGDKAILNHLLELSQEGLNELLAQVTAQLTSSLGELTALIQPILDALEEFAEAAGATDMATGMVNVIGILVDKIVALSENFSLDKLQEILRKLAGIANRAIGITDGSLARIGEQMIDHIVEGLMAAYLEGDYTQPALDSFMVGNNLRRLKDYFKTFLQQQNINLDLVPLVDRLILHLRTKGIDEKLQKIREYVQTIGGGASFIGSLSSTFSVSFNTPQPGPPPPEDPVGWYLSWFDSTWRTDMLGIEDRFDLAKWRVAVESGWDDVPKSKIAFENSKLTPEVMERIAHISYLVGDFIEALMHAISMEGKPYAASIFNLITQAWKGSLTAGMGSSNDQSWVNAYKVLGHNWFDYGTQMLGTFLLGWIPEGNLALSRNQLFYLLSGIRSMGELSFIANYVWLARESLLSILTLINTSSTSAATTNNHLKILGLSNLLSDIGVWLGVWIPGRSTFGINNGGFVGYMFAGSIPGLLFPLFALGATQAFGSVSGAHFGNVLGQAASTTLFKWFLYWNIMWDGDTDNGRYLGMMGYPDKANSPYLLPYENGLEKCCVQGNNGVFSHNDLTLNQTYAYDFTHDHRDEILAIRAGIVTNWGDSLGDDTHNSWNFVFIGHNGPVLSTYDVGQNGATGQTVAEYGHGAHMGVQHAFALYGIPQNFISTTGTRTTPVPIRQGQVVMLAGNTGNSGHNHLHLDIRLVAGGGTIPFTFRNDVGGNGVPTSNRFYTSTTSKVPYVASKEFPLYHPDKESGNAQAATANTITLQTNAHPNDDWYKDCFIMITWANAQGIQFQEIRQITGYDGDSKLATVDSPWDQLPPATATYRIGSKPRASAEPFELNFAAWADYTGSRTTPHNAAQIAATFADGAPNFKYARVGRYHVAALTGTVVSATANTVVLAPGTVINAASMQGRFIVIQNGGTTLEYREIASYTAGTQTVQLVGNWGVQPTSANTYIVGGPAFAQSTADQQGRLTYHGNDTIATGIVVAGAAGTVTLAGATSLQVAEAIGSYVVIQRAGVTINYAQILNYDDGTKLVTIIGSWDRLPIAGDTYFVRGPKFSGNTATPVPSRYLPYPLNWP